MQRYEFFSIFVPQTLLYIMEQNIIQKNMWQMASKAGLILGLISTVYMFSAHIDFQSIFISLGVPEEKSFAGIWKLIPLVIGWILWFAKFAGCVWAMNFFMNRFAAENPEIDNKTTFRMGMITALLSGLLYSGAIFADIAYIHADIYTEQIGQAMQSMASMMDSNTRSMMDTYIENLPQINFFTNLIYCFLFGTVLSKILSRNIPSKDPFADYKPSEQ